AEASGRRRDHGRLLVSVGAAPPVDARFDAIGTFLAPGDLIVVNTSATVPAPLDLDPGTGAPIVVELFGGGHVRLLTPFADSTRLWVATLAIAPSVPAYLAEFGRPIRYRHVPHAWPVEAY